jgi:hypothetical protein
MYNCIITNNYKGIYGYYDNPTGSDYYLDSAKLYNCTIANNVQGIYGYRLVPQLYNCLFWNNGNSISENYDSCIMLNSADNSGVKFKQPSSKQGYEAPDWQTADWSITSGSIAIDAGVNIYYPLDEYPTDIAGNPRIKGSAIDVGAYEY